MLGKDESTLNAIVGFIRCRPEQEGQKLVFIASLCTFCVGSTLQGVLFSQEVMMATEMMLQEKPIDCLDTTVQQQVMLAIASMSRAGLLQHNKILECSDCEDELDCVW